MALTFTVKHHYREKAEKDTPAGFCLPLILRGHDGHLNPSPDSMSKISLGERTLMIKDTSFQFHALIYVLTLN